MDTIMNHQFSFKFYIHFHCLQAFLDPTNCPPQPQWTSCISISCPSLIPCPLRFMPFLPCYSTLTVTAETPCPFLILLCFSCNQAVNLPRLAQQPQSRGAMECLHYDHPDWDVHYKYKIHTKGSIKSVKYLTNNFV